MTNGKVTYFPNLFIFLVTYAGVGKSTALVRGMELLERLKDEVNGDFNLIDEQVTEAAFIKLMSTTQGVQVGNQIMQHSSGYFYASEASSSALQNTHGNFVSTITGFYDCPKIFRKTTMKDGSLAFGNVCFGMLAGATFDYLKTLVNESSVMGGFASRIIYVVNKERLIRTPKWGASMRTDAATRDALFEDLKHIHRLHGSFKPTPSFISAWEAFQPESDKTLAELNSPRLESLYARRSNHVMKLAMLLSISESDSLILEAKHWDAALELVDAAMKDSAFVLSQGAIADRQSQLGVTQMLGQMVKGNQGRMNIKHLRAKALASGCPIDSVTRTLDFMLGCGWLELNASTQDVRLLVDPDRYL